MVDVRVDGMCVWRCQSHVVERGSMIAQVDVCVTVAVMGRVDVHVDVRVTVAVMGRVVSRTHVNISRVRVWVMRST